MLISAGGLYNTRLECWGQVQAENCPAKLKTKQATIFHLQLDADEDAE